MNITIWGGQTDIAQAMWKVQQDRGAASFGRFANRFRVYDIADQDGLAAWMRSQFPDMFYILSKAADGADKRNATFRGMRLTGDQSLTSRRWIETNVKTRGPLGTLYPLKTWTSPKPHGCMKEGDTPSWFFFLPRGGNDPSDPTQPGWGGRFYKTDDGWYLDDRFGSEAPTSVSRWRPQFQEDFALRMSWCLQETN